MNWFSYRDKQSTARTLWHQSALYFYQHKLGSKLKDKVDGKLAPKAKQSLEAHLLASSCIGLHEVCTVVFSQEVFPNTCLQAHAKTVVQTNTSVYYVCLVIPDGSLKRCRPNTLSLHSCFSGICLQGKDLKHWFHSPKQNLSLTSRISCKSTGLVLWQSMTHEHLAHYKTVPLINLKIKKKKKILLGI